VRKLNKYLYIVPFVLSFAVLFSLTLQPDSSLGLVYEYYGGLLNSCHLEPR
jgi:hypothetical protein